MKASKGSSMPIQNSAQAPGEAFAREDSPYCSMLFQQDKAFSPCQRSCQHFLHRPWLPKVGGDGGCMRPVRARGSETKATVASSFFNVTPASNISRASGLGFLRRRDIVSVNKIPRRPGHRLPTSSDLKVADKCLVYTIRYYMILYWL